MPQFDVLIADGDRFRLLEWTLDQGAVLVPVQHYLEPHYEEVRSIKRLEQFQSCGHFFVLRGDWQREKLRMKPYVNKYKGGGFYITQRYGGPYVCYLLYPQRSEDNDVVLGRCSIDYYPWHYIGSVGDRVPPSSSLQMFYSAATRLLKTKGSRVRAAKRVTWITEEGARLLSINVARLPEQWRGRANNEGPDER
jgi:hypothetical protein